MTQADGSGMKTIGAEMKRLIPQGMLQKALAMEWSQSWNSLHPEDPKSSDTAETRLSDLFASRPAGVAFYLGDAKRREVTFTVFRVPDADRPRLTALSRPAVRASDSPAVVIDATTWAQRGEQLDALFIAIDREFLRPQGSLPTALVVTNDQYGRLPRTFDDYGERFHCVRVESDTEAPSEIEKLARGEALVVASRRLAPLERWIAAQFEHERLLLGPADGLATFMRDGVLARLPDVNRPLNECIEEPAKAQKLPRLGPLQLRELMCALAEGKRPSFIQAYDFGAAARSSWASQLGITALATPEEWAAARSVRWRNALRPVDVHCEDRASLESFLALARYDQAPIALEIGGELHLINMPQEGRLPPDPSVHYIDVARAPAPILRVAAALDQLTTADVEEDPFLERLVARLDPEGQESRAYQHARLCLGTHGVTAKEPPAHGPWLEALRQVVSTEFEGVSLRLSGAPKHFFVPEWWAQLASERIRQVPPFSDLLIRRGEKVVGVQAGHSVDRNSVCVTKDRQLARDPDAWLTALRGMLVGRARAEDVDWTGPWQCGSPFEVDDDVWERAEEQVVFTLRALRAAVRAPDSHSLTTGAVLLSLGGGLFARLRIGRCSETATYRPRATALLPLTPSDSTTRRYDVGDLLVQLPTHSATTSGYGVARTHLGPLVPRAITLTACGFHVRVTFVASGLLMDSDPEARLAAAAAGARALELRRREDDDRD